MDRRTVNYTWDFSSYSYGSKGENPVLCRSENRERKTLRFSTNAKCMKTTIEMLSFVFYKSGDIIGISFD